MRTLLPPAAMTISSLAFQLGLQAGWFNSLTWLAPWAWGTSSALWVWWLISHPKIEKEWLRGFHEKVGKGIHPIRAAVSLFFLLFIGLIITAMVRKPQAKQIAKDSETRSTLQPQLPTPVVTPNLPKKSRRQQSKSSGPSVSTAGDNSPAVQQSNSGGINVQQATTGQNSPIINSPVT